jgi:hypothetical protein
MIDLICEKGEVGGPAFGNRQAPERGDREGGRWRRASRRIGALPDLSAG